GEGAPGDRVLHRGELALPGGTLVGRWRRREELVGAVHHPELPRPGEGLQRLFDEGRRRGHPVSGTLEPAAPIPVRSGTVGGAVGQSAFADLLTNRQSRL